MSTENDNVWLEVEKSLKTLRPYLEADGGDIELVEITDEHVVRVRLLGACETCPMSFMTMKAGVEEAIKKAVPEITKIEAINLNAVDNVTE